jgi:hypothetical protein
MAATVRNVIDDVTCKSSIPSGSGRYQINHYHLPLKIAVSLVSSLSFFIEMYRGMYSRDRERFCALNFSDE